MEPGFVEFRNVVEKTESEALERMTRVMEIVACSVSLPSTIL